MPLSSTHHDPIQPYCESFVATGRCAQASSLFDPYTFNSFMQGLKRMAAPPQQGDAQQQATQAQVSGQRLPLGFVLSASNCAHTYFIPP